MDPEIEAARAMTLFSETRALMVMGKVPNVNRAAILFYMKLFIELEPQPCWDIQTAATDGRKVYFNPLWWNNLSQDIRFTVGAHEAGHYAFEHHILGEDKDPKLWNVAADLALNPILAEAGFRFPDNALFPGRGRYRHLPPLLSAPMYYNMLLKESQSNAQGGDGDQAGGGRGPSDGKPQGPGQPKPDPQHGGGDEDSDPGDVEGPQPGEQGGEGQEEAPQKDRPHQGETPPAPGTPDPGGLGGAMPMGKVDQSSRTKEEQRVRGAVAGAIALAQTRGELGASLLREVGEVLTPPVDAYEVLRDFVSKRCKDEYTFRRPNRRFMQQGVCMPSRLSDKLGDVVFMIDCSGSISQDILDRFAARANGILEHYKCSVTLLYHDVPVTHVEQWCPDDGPLKLRCHGGGGTSHVPAFGWVKRNDTGEAPVIVAFTDLYTEFPRQAPHLPVLWFCYGRPARSKPPEVPFGRVVMMEEG